MAAGFRLGRLVAACAVVVSVVGGCGGGSSSTDDTAGLDGTPLKVAVFVNESGPLPSGEENAAIVTRAWAKSVNASGGVDGRPVEIVIADTKGDAPTATSAAARIASDQSIVAGVMFDGATEGLIGKKLTEAKLPIIGGMGYDPSLWGRAVNWLPLTTTIPSIFNMGMTLGKDVGASKVAMTICAEVAPCEAAEPVVKSASANLGLEYTGTYKIAAASPNFTAQCLKINDSGVDYVMLGAATPVAALRLAGDCSKQNFDGQWGLFGGVIVPKVMRENDPGVKLALAVNSFPWFADGKPVADYRQMMKSQDVPEDSWGDPHGTAAYATMELFRKALDAAGDSLPPEPTRQDVIEAYGANVRDETLDGLLAQPVTFVPGKPNKPVSCYWFGSYEGGTFSDAQLDEPQCDPASLAADSS